MSYAGNRAYGQGTKLLKKGIFDEIEDFKNAPSKDVPAF